MDIMSTRALRSNRKAMMAKVSNKRRKEMNTNTFTLKTKFQQVGSLLITVTAHDPSHPHTVTWKSHFLLIERDSHQMQIKFHADVFSLENNRAEYFHSMIQQLYSSPYWVSFDVRYTAVLLGLYLSTRLQYGSFLSSMVQTQSSGMSAASHNIILKQKYQRKLPCLVPSGAQPVVVVQVCWVSPRAHICQPLHKTLQV